MVNVPSVGHHISRGSEEYGRLVWVVSSEFPEIYSSLSGNIQKFVKEFFFT